MSKTFKIPAISTGLREYLDDYEKKNDDDPKFRVKPTEINAVNLAVVAFLQDSKTKAVLQAVYADVKAPSAQ